MKSKFGKNSRN